jgi:hypothetical protein
MTRVACSWVAVVLLVAGWVASPLPVSTSMALEQDGQPLTDEDRLFLQQLQNAVAADDRSWIADHIKYPITVTLGGEREVLEGKDEVLAHYGEIINRRVRDAVLAQRFETLFKNWRGTMIGNGELWFFHGLEGSDLCREVRPPRRGVTGDCTHPDPARRWSPPRTGIVAINNVDPQKPSE